MTNAATRFDVLRSALYHTARRRWFDGLARFLNFVVVIAGAASLSDIVPKAHSDVLRSVSAIVTLLAGTLQLVYDFAGQARTHEILQKRFYELLAEIEATENTEGREQEWKARFLKICADEPPMLRVLDAVAYNEAADALDTDWRLRITPWQSIVRHFLAFNGTSFPWSKIQRPP